MTFNNLANNLKIIETNYNYWRIFESEIKTNTKMETSKNTAAKFRVEFSNPKSDSYYQVEYFGNLEDATKAFEETEAVLLTQTENLEDSQWRENNEGLSVTLDELTADQSEMGEDEELSDFFHNNHKNLRSASTYGEYDILADKFEIKLRK